MDIYLVGHLHKCVNIQMYGQFRCMDIQMYDRAEQSVSQLYILTFEYMNI